MTASLARCYRFGRFAIDERSAGLRRDEAPVPLRPKSFDVLLYLARNRGRLITKDELFDHVWANVVVTDNSLVQCIKEVRQALGDDGQTMIETVAKRGYIFTPTVIECDDTQSPAPVAAIEPAVSPGTLATRRRGVAWRRRYRRRHRGRASDRRRPVVGFEPADEPAAGR